MDGWIKLHRKSIDSLVFQNEKLWKVWSWCLMRANHKAGYKEFFQGKEITLQPGQFITGRFQGAHECSMKPSTFRDQLGRLKELGNLDINSDNKKSLITLINWGLYQANESHSDINSDNKPTTNRQQTDTDKNVIKKEVIFSFWNDQKIIVHRKLTSDMDKKLKKAIKDYSIEEIKTSIQTYAEIVKSDKYFFNHKWSLDEFLQRGIQKFIEPQIAKENYLNRNNGKHKEEHEKEFELV